MMEHLEGDEKGLLDWEIICKEKLVKDYINHIASGINVGSRQMENNKKQLKYHSDKLEEAKQKLILLEKEKPEYFV